MRLTRPVSISLLLLTLRATSAQTASDYFNSGAQLYIGDDKEAALKKVEDGLKIYADDEKLKKLEALLKEKQQSQSSQSQQNPQKQQQDKQQPPQQQQANGQKNQQQQNQQEPGKSSQDQQGEEKQGPGRAERDEKERAKQEGQQGSSAQEKGAEKTDQRSGGQLGQMTPEEAKRLLDAQKGDEQILQMKPVGKPPDNRPLRDW
jgi:Ca-activated chloride channel homolog